MLVALFFFTIHHARRPGHLLASQGDPIFYGFGQRPGFPEINLFMPPARQVAFRFVMAGNGGIITILLQDFRQWGQVVRGPVLVAGYLVDQRVDTGEYTGSGWRTNWAVGVRIVEYYSVLCNQPVFGYC